MLAPKRYSEIFVPGGEEPVRIQQPGQWLVLPRLQGHTVAALGGETRAIEIEVR